MSSKSSSIPSRTVSPTPDSYGVYRRTALSGLRSNYAFYTLVIISVVLSLVHISYGLRDEIKPMYFRRKHACRSFEFYDGEKCVKFLHRTTDKKKREILNKFDLFMKSVNGTFNEFTALHPEEWCDEVKYVVYQLRNYYVHNNGKFKKSLIQVKPVGIMIAVSCCYAISIVLFLISVFLRQNSKKIKTN